jgi:hypothetical protein
MYTSKLPEESLTFSQEKHPSTQECTDGTPQEKNTLCAQAMRYAVGSRSKAQISKRFQEIIRIGDGLSVLCTTRAG